MGGGAGAIGAADRRSASADRICDVPGQFGRLMARHGIGAMLVRPDFHLFGGATDRARLDTLLSDFARQTHRHAKTAAHNPVAA